MILTWVIAALIAFYMIPHGPIDSAILFPSIVAVVLVLAGTMIYMGKIRALAEIDVGSEKGVSKYDIKKITSLMGAFLIVTSYLLFVQGLLFSGGNYEASQALTHTYSRYP